MSDEAVKEVSVDVGGRVELECGVEGPVNWTKQPGNISKDSATFKVIIHAKFNFLNLKRK